MPATPCYTWGSPPNEKFGKGTRDVKRKKKVNFASIFNNVLPNKGTPTPSFVHNHQHDVDLQFINIFNNLTNKSSSVFSLLVCATHLLNKKEWLPTKSFGTYVLWSLRERGSSIPQGEAIAVYLWFLWPGIAWSKNFAGHLPRVGWFSPKEHLDPVKIEHNGYKHIHSMFIFWISFFLVFWHEYELRCYPSQQWEVKTLVEIPYYKYDESW